MALKKANSEKKLVLQTFASQINEFFTQGPYTPMGEQV